MGGQFIVGTNRYLRLNFVINLIRIHNSCISVKFYITCTKEGSVSSIDFCMYV